MASRRSLRASASLKLDSVTVCCVDCAYHDLAASALRFTLSGCDFAEALFFSDRDCGVDRVRWVAIDRLDSAEAYSNFLIHRLHEHIQTEHVLVIDSPRSRLRRPRAISASIVWSVWSACTPINSSCRRRPATGR